MENRSKDQWSDSGPTTSSFSETDKRKKRIIDTSLGSLMGLFSLTPVIPMVMEYYPWGKIPSTIAYMLIFLLINTVSVKLFQHALGDSAEDDELEKAENELPD